MIRNDDQNDDDGGKAKLSKGERVVGGIGKCKRCLGATQISNAAMRALDLTFDMSDSQQNW
jgi:hypothetical protein